MNMFNISENVAIKRKQGGNPNHQKHGKTVDGLIDN